MSVFDLVKDLLVSPTLAPLSPPLAQAQPKVVAGLLAPLAPLAGAECISSIEDPATTLPVWCRSDCPALEIIPGAGSGCVRALPDGPWREEWRALGTMATCPKLLH